jgi:flagellin
MQIQVEVSQLVDEVNRIASHAQFNGMNLLTGSFAQNSAINKTMQLQVGANMDQSESIYIGTMTAQALGLTNAQGEAGILSLTTPDEANQAIGSLDSALRQISKQRADLGAYQNRFEMASNGVAIAAENLQAAESRIRDADMASEMVGYTKNSILSQTGTAMLAQANVQTQSVLQLLG